MQVFIFISDELIQAYLIMSYCFKESPQLIVVHHIKNIIRTNVGVSSTVDCHYIMVQYCKILDKWLQELRQNINQMMDPQQTLHTMPIMNIREKTDCIIKAPHCILVLMYFWVAT